MRAAGGTLSVAEEKGFVKEMNMSEERILQELKERNLKKTPTIFIVFAILVLVAVSGNYITFLDSQLYG